MQTFSITTPDDFHLHVHDGELMKLVVPHIAQQIPAQYSVSNRPVFDLYCENWDTDATSLFVPDAEVGRTAVSIVRFKRLGIEVGSQ